MVLKRRPREKRQLTVQPYGQWNDPELKNLTNAKLRVDVLNFEDANGQKMIVVDRNNLDLKRKVRTAIQ